MMTSSNGNIFSVTGPLCGEFTGQLWISLQRQVTRSFDVFFDLRLNKRLSKQSRIWWFETSSRQLWRHCNAEQLWRKPLIIGGLQVHKSSDDTASNVSCERAKGKRDQTTFKVNRRDYFRPYLFPWHFCVSPHELNIGVERYAGENVISNNIRQKTTPLANDISTLIRFRVGYMRFNLDLSKMQKS